MTLTKRKRRWRNRVAVMNVLVMVPIDCIGASVGDHRYCVFIDPVIGHW